MKVAYIDLNGATRHAESLAKVGIYHIFVKYEYCVAENGGKLKWANIPNYDTACTIARTLHEKNLLSTRK